MKAKLPLLLAAAFTSVMTLAGCGGHNEEDSGAITVAVLGDQIERNIIKTFITEYKKIPGNENKKISARYMNNYNDYIYNNALEGTLPDIIQVFDYNCAYYANTDLDGAGHSLLLPISSYMTRDNVNESDLVDSVVSITKCKNNSSEMCWVPRDYNKVVVALNKNIFNAAGVELPSDTWTWADFLSTCDALKAKSNVIMQYTGKDFFWPVDMNLNFEAVYSPILKSYEVDLINPNTKKCFDNKTDEAKTIWGKLLNMVVDGLASVPPKGEDKYPFSGKQSAMMFITRPDLPSYVESLGGSALDFVALPSYEDLNEGQKSYIGMGCTGYGMTPFCAKSKRDAAWDFLKFIISEDGQNAFSKMGSGIPCLKSLLNDPNAEFTKYISADINHHAFVAYPERDLLATYFLEGINTEKQGAIYKYFRDHVLKDFIESGDNDTYIIKDAYYNTLKSNVEALLR